MSKEQNVRTIMESRLTKKQEPILYAAAYNEDYALIIAREAPKKRIYSCVNCGNTMRVRRGPIRRAHFAHINKDFDSTCNPETVLHKSFKIALHNRIQDCLDRSIGLSVEWKCQLCGKIHEGNLVKKIQISNLEFPMGDFIADVALLDNDGNVVCAIEVVVSSPPKEGKFSFYKNNGIWMTIFRLTTDEDMDKVYETPLNPTSFDYCPNTFLKKEIKSDSPHNLDEITSVSVADFISYTPKQNNLKATPKIIEEVGNLKLLKKVVLNLLLIVVIILFLWQWFTR